MNRLELAGKELLKLGYEKCGLLNGYKTAYWKVERKNNEYVTKIVVTVDCDMANIYTTEGIERVKDEAVCQFEDVTRDNVLVIAYVKPKMHDIKCDNVIFVFHLTSKVKTRNIIEMFEKEAFVMKEYAKTEKRNKIHRENAYGPKAQNYSTAITYILIAIILYSYMSLTGNKSSTYGISPLTVFKEGQSYRLFTYMFAHSGIGHLASNCLSLLVIGRLYAAKRGTFNFLIVYLIGGILSGITSLFCTMMFGSSHDIITVGASGAIYAILGGLLVNVLIDSALKQQKAYYVKYVIITVVLNCFGGGVDNVCHFAGLFFGMFLEFVITKIDSIDSADKYIATRDKTRVFGM